MFENLTRLILYDKGMQSYTFFAKKGDRKKKMFGSFYLISFVGISKAKQVKSQ